MAEKEETCPQTPDDNGKSPEELSEEQSGTLDKIMAELEGRTEEDTEAAPDDNRDDGADDQQDNAVENQEDTANGLTDEQEEALKKIMAEIEGTPDTEDSSAAETSITAEQEETLNKIVAELQGDPESETSESNDQDENPPPVERPSDAPDTDGLTPEQEASLQQIMAEIESKTDEGAKSTDEDDPAPPPAEPELEAEPPDIDTQEDPPAAESSESSSSTDSGFEELDMSDFESELAKVVSEANSQSDSAPKPKQRKAKASRLKTPPAAPADAEITPETEEPVEDSESEDKPPDPAMKDEPEGEAGAVDNQKVEEPSPLPDTSTQSATSESQEPPAFPPDDAPAADSKSHIAPLPEASPTPTAASCKRPSSKKMWMFAGFGGGAILLIVAAVMIYPFFLPPDTDTAPQSTVVEEKEAPPAEPMPASQASPQLEPILELIQAQNDTLSNISSEIKTLRTSLLDKLKEINDLKQYYQQGINETEKHLADLIRKEKMTTLKSALQDQRMELGLRTIQRRKSYITKLSLPFDQVLQASEELLYLERKAEIFQEMTKNTSGISLDEFDKQVSQAIDRVNKVKNSLTIDQVGPPTDALDIIWNELQTKAKETGKIKLGSAEQAKQNQDIWQEICAGKFDRKYALTELTPKVAQCLLQWNGKDLYLNQLKTLSPEVAQVLSHWPGKWLGLNGLESLSPDAARHLARWKGERLSLNGLTELSPKTTMYLSKWQGKQLELVGLKHIGQWENPKIELFVSDKLRNQIPK